jgi:hypothetical protein
MSSAKLFCGGGGAAAAAAAAAGSSKCFSDLAAPVMNVPTQNIASKPPAATPTASVAADVEFLQRWGSNRGSGN